MEPPGPNRKGRAVNGVLGTLAYNDAFMLH